MNKRLNYIDQLKGFAILLVVAGHVLEFCLYKNNFSFLHDMIYSFHMPLFAFLSGLVFTSLSDYKLVGRKLVRQSYRLLIPFLTMGFLYSYTIRKGEDFWLQPYKLGLWYLFFLWQCYVITNIYNIILLPCVSKNSLRRVFIDILWVVVVCGIAKAMMVMCSPESNGVIGTVHLSKLYPFFFVGSVLKRVNFTPPYWRKCDWSVSICSIAWLLLIWNVNIPPSLYSLKLSFCFGILAIIPIVYWFAKFEKVMPTKISRTLMLFGRYSLEIYMFHRFMTSTCNVLFIGDFIQATKSWTLEFCMVLTLSLIMSWISVYAAKILALNKIIAFLLLGQYKKL